jgi:dethiobiotin synthetase
VRTVTSHPTPTTVDVTRLPDANVVIGASAAGFTLQPPPVIDLSDSLFPEPEPTTTLPWSAHTGPDSVPPEPEAALTPPSAGHPPGVPEPRAPTHHAPTSGGHQPVDAAPTSGGHQPGAPAHPEPTSAVHEPGHPSPASATHQPGASEPGESARATTGSVAHQAGVPEGGASAPGSGDSAAAPGGQPTARRPEDGEWRGIVLITGTDTDVGKTIVTAAIAAAAQASGLRVAVIKPGQTGTVTGAPSDIDVINRLAGPDTSRTLAEYPEPMAPLAAANFASLPPLELYEVVDAIRAEADKHDLVLVEGAGGLLVPMGLRPGGEPWTVADLATTLGVSTIVVARAGLGTLNHTALTLEALARRGVPAGVILGAWPADPELIHWSNLSELVPHLVGALPEGAGRMDPGVFRRSAPGWLTPALHGVLDNWRVWAEEAG